MTDTMSLFKTPTRFDEPKFVDISCVTLCITTKCRVASLSDRDTANRVHLIDTPYIPTSVYLYPMVEIFAFEMRFLAYAYLCVLKL